MLILNNLNYNYSLFNNNKTEMEEDIYAEPKNITDINDCLFYSTIDIPNYGTVKGDKFDFRGQEAEYLGNVNFKNKRVLDIGAASGFFSFYIEKQGAEVIAFDLSKDYSSDIISSSPDQYHRLKEEEQRLIEKLNNAFWFTHRALNSKIKIVHGSVYKIPKQIELVDVSICSSVLLHLRDPFLALQNILTLTKETVIITDLYPRRWLNHILGFLNAAQFLPAKETWWFLPSKTVSQMIEVLGFKKNKIAYHAHKSQENKKMLFYTLVGNRERQ